MLSMFYLSAVLFWIHKNFMDVKKRENGTTRNGLSLDITGVLVEMVKMSLVVSYLITSMKL